jgi:hypothetical protein
MVKNQYFSPFLFYGNQALSVFSGLHEVGLFIRQGRQMLKTAKPLDET